METATYRVPESNYNTLVEKIEKLQRKAAKLNLPPLMLETTSTEDVPLVDRGEPPLDWGLTCGEGQWYQFVEKKDPAPGDKVAGYRRYYHVQLHGEAPTLPGWQLLCIIEHTTDSEIGNVLRTVPGKEAPLWARTAKPDCGHCNVSRRRNETFVLAKADQPEVLQVGRNCLADFCRSPEAAEHMVKMAEMLEDALRCCRDSEYDDFVGGRRLDRLGLHSALLLTSSFMRAFGWTSRTAARDNPDLRATADLVSTVLLDPKVLHTKGNEDLAKAAADIREQDEADATAAVEWVRAMRPQAEELKDYLFNLLVVCSDDTVKSKHMGLACSLLPTFLRDKSRMIEREKRAKLGENSRHFGTVKKREVFTLTLLGIKSFDSYYGTKHLHRFLDQDGNLAIWWASVDKDMEVGATYRVKATVKGHAMYKDKAQTELSRCVVEECVSEAPAVAVS